MVSSDRRERPSNHEGPGSQPSQPADPAHPSRPPNSSNSGTLRRPNRPTPRQRIPRPSARPHTPGMRPFTWPSSNHDAPTLWERAKAMFSALTTRFGSAMRVAFRRFLTSQQRRDLILHLEPAEKLVRVLIIAEAITLLVMTPMGLKLRQTTRPCRIPDPPPQVGAHKPHPDANRIQAAMMTIAAHQPRIDPRIAEREAREAEQKRTAALELQRHPLDSRPRRAHRALKAAARPRSRRSHPAHIQRTSARHHRPGQRRRRHDRPAPPPRPTHRLYPARTLPGPLAPPPSRRALGPWLPRILQRLHPGKASLRRARPRLRYAAR